MAKKFKNALISVSDKTGLIEFVKPLAEQGMRVVSTGGTAKFMRENGIEVVDISEQTQFPEIMDGRVKTLHPKVHMALLCRDHVEEDQKILKENEVEAFDLVIGNLYPFEEALTKGLDDRGIIEFVDIGGPSFLRSAAKSYERVAVVCDPKDYAWIQEKESLSVEDKKLLASKIFAHTSSYDSMIANELSGNSIGQFCLGGEFISELRYGENPQQTASWFRRKGATNGINKAEILQGKALSYNNLLDLDAAIGTLRDFSQTCAVAVKHNNPCGVGLGATGLEAVTAALKSDPVSVFGGIVAINTEIDAAMAEFLAKIFLECIVAPSVSEEAKQVFAKKKNLRILEWKEVCEREDSYQVQTVDGGYLVQSSDEVKLWDEDWKIIGDEPTDEIKLATELAWKVCRHLKSNAISITSSSHSLGLGMGQVNRVDAVAQSIERWKCHHSNIKDVVLASDAFFPFPDSIEKIAEAGIQWVVQPGGSIKDNDVIEKAKELGVNLILTGKRHFRH